MSSCLTDVPKRTTHAQEVWVHSGRSEISTRTSSVALFLSLIFINLIILIHAFSEGDKKLCLALVKSRAFLLMLAVLFLFILLLGFTPLKNYFGYGSISFAFLILSFAPAAILGGLLYVFEKKKRTKTKE